MNLNHCKLIEFPKISDPRGNLTFVEGENHIPFDIKRVFYMYEVPAGKDRGGHAHKELHELLICLSGSFDVEIDDGVNKKRITLSQPWKGLHVPPMIWASEINFDPGSICLVMASERYEEADYIRDYSEFIFERQRR